MNVCQSLLLFCLLHYTLALECEVVPGNLKQIDAGVGVVGGVNNDNEVFLLLGKEFRKINVTMKHFTVGPAGELAVNLSNSVFKFQSGQFSSIPITFKQVDAGGDQIIAGVTPLDDIFCLNKDANNIGPSSSFTWVQLAGKLKYYSCGPYSCWGVNAAGNILIRRSVWGASCGGSNSFDVITGSMSMVEVATDGSVFAVDTQGSLFQRIGVSASNPIGTGWLGYLVCPDGHKHVTYDLGRLYVICSDGSIRRCI
ncbi:fish-egg lectin-like [Carassius carassius]|uniref:fish-egg lectin-like n=1 Tax=Carassius carassius TaxID=217509 RepID=UPI0028687DA1|nr:fish-egg lectin-like [Carassius carassius]